MWCFWRPNVPDGVLPWFEQDFGIWALIHKRWISVMSVQEIHRKSEEITYDHFSAALMGKSSRHHWGLHAWFAHPLHTVYNLRSQEHGSWEKLSSLLHMLTGLSNRCWHRAASLPCFQAWKHWCNDTVPVARCMPKTSMGLQQWHPQVYAHPLENTELEGGHTFQAQLDFIDIGYKPLQRISRNFVADLQMWILNVFVNDDIAAICNLCGVCPILEDLSQIFICQRCLARILHQPQQGWSILNPCHTSPCTSRKSVPPARASAWELHVSWPNPAPTRCPLPSSRQWNQGSSCHPSPARTPSPSKTNYLRRYALRRRAWV